MTAILVILAAMFLAPVIVFLWRAMAADISQEIIELERWEESKKHTMG